MSLPPENIHASGFPILISYINSPIVRNVGPSSNTIEVVKVVPMMISKSKCLLYSRTEVEFELLLLFSLRNTEQWKSIMSKGRQSHNLIIVSTTQV